MSAYALPGAFPPMAGFTFESSCQSGWKSSESGEETANRPQCHQSSSSSLQFKPVCFSSMSSSPIAHDSPLTPVSKLVEEKKEEDITSPREVGISVREAKIDLVKLVKSLTTSTKTKSRKRDTNPPPPPVVHTKQSSDVNASDEEEEDDPHKEAIQFELSISFNGRTYSATRTLPNIIQLRNNLISEISSRRKVLRDRRPRWIKKAMEGEADSDDDETAKTVEMDDVYDVTIPELPDYYSSDDRNTGGSFAGRGFTLLQALLRSYCPVMEGWLQKVTDLVPPMDSPSLSHFLWEPVSGEVKMPTRSSNHSFSTLVSIKEYDSGEEDAEDEFGT